MDHSSIECPHRNFCKEHKNQENYKLFCLRNLVHREARKLINSFPG